METSFSNLSQQIALCTHALMLPVNPDCKHRASCASISAIHGSMCMPYGPRLRVATPVIIICHNVCMITNQGYCAPHDSTTVHLMLAETRHVDWSNSH